MSYCIVQDMSVRPSETKKNAGKPKLAGMFPSVGVIGVTIFSCKNQKLGSGLEAVVEVEVGLW